MTAFLGSLFGALLGTTIGAVVAWRYYLAPKLTALRVVADAARRAPSRSQPTATTRGFVAPGGDVTIQHAGWGRIKKTPHL